MIRYIWNKISQWVFSRGDTDVELEVDDNHNVDDCENESQSEDERPNSTSDNQEKEFYYGVCLEEGTCLSAEDDTDLVFDDQKAALSVVTKYKGARFKRFTTRQDALSFCESSRHETSLPQGADAASISSERSSFSAPSAVALIAFRKAIERGELGQVRELISSNPRYLVSSSDTPVILQEGFHYTALHVAAKANQAEICRLILDTIKNPTFMMTLNPDDSPENCKRRIDVLTDYYLNLPDSDKANNETCLHFASKFGNVEVVRCLVSLSKMDALRRNKYGETAMDVVCTRSNNTTNKNKEEIIQLLQGSVMVPLLRSEDNTIQPVIGEPCPVDGTTLTQAVFPHSFSPRDPVLLVKAYAGPMSPDVAKSFRRRWKTPPSLSPGASRRNVRREDCDRGEERIGREIAHEMKVSWTEYWGFLGEFIDLSTDKGLEKLENYFQTSWRRRRTPEILRDDRTLNGSDTHHDIVKESLANQISEKGDDVFVAEEGSSYDVSCKCKTEAATRRNNTHRDDIDAVCDVCGRRIKNRRGEFTFGHDVAVPGDVKSPILNEPSVVSPRTDQMFTELCEEFGRFRLGSPDDDARSGGDILRVFSDDKEKCDSSFNESRFDDQGMDCLTHQALFIHGSEPTKLDIDVYRAIGDAHIDSNLYPHVHRWMQLVSSYNTDTQLLWPSPARLKSRQRAPSLPQSPLCDVTTNSPLQRSSDTAASLSSLRTKLFQT